MTTIYTDETAQVEVELAKFDKTLYNLTESWEQAEGWEKIECQYAFIVAAFGKSKDSKDYLRNRLGGATVETVDLMAMGALFMELQSVYEKVIKDTESEIMNAKYRQLGDLTENLAPVISAVNAVENMSAGEKAIAAKQAQGNNRQGFKRIK